MNLEFLNILVNRIWLGHIISVLEGGYPISPRKDKTKEILNASFVVDMNKPIITIPYRKLSYTFMVAEAYWILSGDNRTESIVPYNQNMAQFSDDGTEFFGAYGPQIAKQYSYIVKTLTRDRESRQAVLTTWRQDPPMSKDIPCTVSDQWLIRDGYLHLIHNMRSSDVWLGVPYDVFNFSMLSAMICLDLRQDYPELQLGSIFFNAGSSHLYDKNMPAIEGMLVDLDERPKELEYNALDLDEFDNKTQFLKHLELCKDKRFSETKHNWLMEMAEWTRPKKALPVGAPNWQPRSGQ